jgi:hypothetical protein
MNIKLHTIPLAVAIVSHFRSETYTCTRCRPIRLVRLKGFKNEGDPYDQRHNVGLYGIFVNISRMQFAPKIT